MVTQAGHKLSVVEHEGQAALLVQQNSDLSGFMIPLANHEAHQLGQDLLDTADRLTQYSAGRG